MINESNGSELRKTGISVIGDIRWGTHFCCFYETKQDLLDILVPYFKAGLENNEFCIWVLSQTVTADEARQALRDAVPDLDRFLEKGTMEIHGCDAWYLGKGCYDPQRVLSSWSEKLSHATATGFGGLRVSGDGGWVQKNDWMAFHQYEKQVARLIADQRSIILCTYPLEKSGAAEILDVLDGHQFAAAKRQGEWQVVQSLESIQAKAEVNRLNKELQRIVRKTPQPPLILRYGVAVLAVIAALTINRLLHINLVGAPAMLFLCAIMFSAWYGGLKPSLLAMPLAVLAFAYYFVSPFNSWSVDVREIPRLLLFVLSSLIVISLSAAQRRGAESLRQARDVLTGTVEELKLANQALRTENVERKLAEAAVRQAEDRIRLIIDTIPTMAWSLEPDGSLDFVNQRWIEYTGLSLEEALTDANRIVYPDDLPQALGKWASNMATGKPHEAEMRLRRVDKEYRWFLVRVSPLRDAQGNIVKWYGVSLDIEDRKKAEIAARALIDAIPHQIYSSPPDGDTDYCNERWRSYTGLELEDLKGYGWKAMVHPDDRDRVLKAWRESVAKGTSYEQEARLRANDGTYRWFLSRAVPWRDAEGHIRRWYGTNTDIEDRKRAEEALRESETELKGAYHQLRILSRQLFHLQEEERRHLARELHDEIGQILTAAKINLTIIAPEVQAHVAGRLEDSIELLDRLLTQVRQLSLDLHSSLLDDLGLAPALRSLLDEQAHRAGLRTQFYAPEPFEKLGSEIQTAGFRIAQEAITNVLRHAKARFVGVRLEIEDGSLRMKIWDDGDGFEPAELERRTHERFRFGLMGMRERAALVGGRVRIISSPGKGTTVEVSLPLNGWREGAIS